MRLARHAKVEDLLIGNFKKAYDWNEWGWSVEKGSSQFMRSKAKYVIIGLAVLLIAMLEWQRAINGRSMSDEHYAFLELAEVAHKMIAENASGVLTDTNGSHIRSFDDFFAYVARNKPEWVSDKEAANPFPGLLHERQYGRSRSVTPEGTGLLFWSETVYERPIGRVQMRLTSSGKVLTLLNSVKFTRTTKPATNPNN